MTAPVGPSFFQDLATVVYNSTTAVNIYAVESITVERGFRLLEGKDNNKKRTVAIHATEIRETVTINTEDIYALKTILGQTPAPANLTFTQKAYTTETLTTNPLGDQSVTIKSVVWDRDSIRMPSKNNHMGSITGFCLEQSDGSDPIVYA